MDVVVDYINIWVIRSHARRQGRQRIIVYLCVNLVTLPSTKCGKWSLITKKRKEVRLQILWGQKKIGITRLTNTGWYVIYLFQSAQASYNGVLGGYANLSSTDISGSFKFVFSYFKAHPEHTRDRVIDCGAGIGRIAK